MDLFLPGSFSLLLDCEGREVELGKKRIQGSKESCLQFCLAMWLGAMPPPRACVCTTIKMAESQFCPSGCLWDSSPKAKAFLQVCGCLGGHAEPSRQTGMWNGCFLKVKLGNQNGSTYSPQSSSLGPNGTRVSQRVLLADAFPDCTV